MVKKELSDYVNNISKLQHFRKKRNAFGGLSIFYTLLGTYTACYQEDITFDSFFFFSLGLLLGKYALHAHAAVLQKRGSDPQQREKENIQNVQHSLPQERYSAGAEARIMDAEAYAAFHGRILYAGYEQQFDALREDKDHEGYLH